MGISVWLSLRISVISDGNYSPIAVILSCTSYFDFRTFRPLRLVASVDDSSIFFRELRLSSSNFSMVALAWRHYIIVRHSRVSHLATFWLGLEFVLDHRHSSVCGFDDVIILNCSEIEKRLFLNCSLAGCLLLLPDGLKVFIVGRSLLHRWVRPTRCLVGLLNQGGCLVDWRVELHWFKSVTSQLWRICGAPRCN